MALMTLLLAAGLADVATMLLDLNILLAAGLTDVAVYWTLRFIGLCGLL